MAKNQSPKRPKGPNYISRLYSEKKILQAKWFNITLIVVFGLYAAIVFTGLCVDSAYGDKSTAIGSEPVKIPFLILEMLLLPVIVADIVLRAFLSGAQIKAATGRVDRYLDYLYTTLLLFFWLIEWFVGNPVLRGFLRVRIFFVIQ